MIAKIATKASYLILFTLLTLLGKAQLTANFNSDKISGCSPVVVNFLDLSVGTPTQWKWDLGNGTISYLQSPSVTYFTPGTYAVKLVIKKGNAADSIVKVNYITVFSKPAINITADNTTGCFPLPVHFTDSSTSGSGTINSWIWDFGDGFSSESQSPQHTYTNSGNFNVSVKIINSYGCYAAITKTSYVTISDGVRANFSNNTPSACTAPVNVQFTNLSAGTGSLKYQWSFGDGSTSTDLNPLHIYADKGSYSIKLIATNSSGCSDTIEKTNSVNIGSVIAKFTTPGSVCLGKVINFSNLSAPTPTMVKWDFGDSTGSSDYNTTKLYQSPGTYQVKLVTSIGVCSDSTTKTITVNPSPKALFIADNTTTCQSTLKVTFTNQSVGGSTYKWDFGDGDTSSLSNPVHNYIKDGIFTVSLTITNASGCSDTYTQNSLIQIIPPTVNILNLPDSGCAPFTKTFSFASNMDSQITGYAWDFGDGTFSTEKTPTHIYNDAGLYTITLFTRTANGCTSATKVNSAIKVSNIPHVMFSANPTLVCAKLPVEFTDETKDTVNRWLWNFGDGGTSTDKDPKHNYSDTGYFDVQLIAWNGGCPDTVKFEKFVFIKPPIAKFSVDLSCTTPFVKTFTDKSIGADTWFWNFGDGTSSTVKSPVHTYSTPGNYEVTLTVHNNETGCDYDRKAMVPVVESHPSFSASDTEICKNTSVLFTVPVADRAFISNYSWSFGDNNTLNNTAGSIGYSYSKAGLYDVELITTDAVGCNDTLYKPTYIRVNGPTTNFVSSVPGNCINTTIYFTDKSVSDGLHAIEKWIWVYGDGKTDTILSVHGRPDSASYSPYSHLYSRSGNYSVSLKTIDNKGCSDSYINPVSVIITDPKADFTSTDTLSCISKNITFSNLSNGLNLMFSWNFGDTARSTVTNPAHLYSNTGFYSVSLKVTDKFGCTDSIIKHNYIDIVLPKADFIMSDSISTCPPLLVNFTDISKNSVSVRWDFGDSTFSDIRNPMHFYTYPGNYIVKQKIIGPNGCEDIKQRTIVIRGPKGTFRYNPLVGCNPVKIDFTATTQDNVSFIWDYSDGTTFTTVDSNVTHTYKNLGAYIPRMILIDKEGCAVPIPGKDTIRVDGANARFIISKRQFCDSGYVSFKDTSNSYDKIISYKWDFGNGDKSNLQNVTYQYTKAGTYTIKLTVETENGCKDTTVARTPIMIVSSPKVDFTNTFSGCVPLSEIFNGKILASDTSAWKWNWDFGNGITSTVQNPGKQLYDKANKYNVNLTVTNSSGCVTTVQKTFEAFPIPTVSAGIDTLVCKGSSIKLQASGADTYIWRKSSTLNCTSCPDPSVNPAIETRYFVTGTTHAGCSDSSSVLVKVKYPFKIQVSRTDTICNGGSAKLEASGAYSYAWSPFNGVNSSSITVKPDTTTTYTVIGTDDRSCFNDTGYIRIKVYPIPTVNAGDDKTINIGKSITLTPDISKDVTAVNWSPAIGLVNHTNNFGITVKPRQTTEYTVEAKNPGGCTSEDKITIFVICNGANIFMPNSFSPNGDGINDLYYPRGTGIFKIKNLRIFNRWGELVFDKNNFNANDASGAWDGRYKGVLLGSDVFVYTLDVICGDDEELTFKGNIALLN